MPAHDVVIVGSGPNGLAAAVALARSGLSTLVVEAADTPGGGARTAPLTLPGFQHDVCSAVHPLGAASPFFGTLALEHHGLSWVHPDVALAHVLPDGSAVTLERSLSATAAQLGPDGDAYRSLFEPIVEGFDALLRMILGPLRLPADPLLLVRFGLSALQSARGLCQARFRAIRAPALLAGIAAHAMQPLDRAGTASFGLVLAAAGHAAGWPLAKGGSSAITAALLSCLHAAGGELWLNHPVRRRSDLPPARAHVFDVGPRQLLEILGAELPASYARRLQGFRYGPGAYKIDWALRAPIPWKDPRCARAATVHLAGDFEDVNAAETLVHAGAIAERPFVLLVQPSLFDASRAPAGAHTAWAYCHVPHASAWNAAPAIEAQVERYAPGFRELVLARATKNACELQRFNPNYVGGDINGGAATLDQLFLRPVARLDPYTTPLRDIFLCSSSTPPGGGVHGMCGYWAAQSVARKVFGQSLREERSGSQRPRPLQTQGAAVPSRPTERAARLP